MRTECLSVFLGHQGNSLNFLGSGWSQPEAEFTWTIGSESSVEFSSLSNSADFILVLRGMPAIHLPFVKSQSIEIWSSSVRIAKFLAFESFEWRVFVPRACVSAGRLIIYLRHSNAFRPSAFGSGDGRELGVAYKKLTLIEAQPTNNFSDVACRGVEISKGGQAKKLYEKLAVPNVDGINGTVNALLRSLRAGDAAAVSAIIKGLDGLLVSHVGFEAGCDHSIIRAVFSGNGRLQILFKDRALLPNAIGLEAVSSRLVTILPLLQLYCLSGYTAGQCTINLGDEAHEDGVAFCANNPFINLVPDPHYLMSAGYESIRNHWLRNEVPWIDRRQVAFWRGSTTGYRREEDVHSLERVRFCKFATSPEYRDMFDVGFSSIAQIDDREEIEQIRKLGLMKEYVALQRMQEWKFQIDIDGNSSAWGLLQKLLSKSVVFKVDSGVGWRQWYYDFLVPYENYIPISSGFEDFPEKLKYYTRNDRAALQVAMSAQRLALSLTLESQIDYALSSIERAVIKNYQID